MSPIRGRRRRPSSAGSAPDVSEAAAPGAGLPAVSIVICTRDRSASLARTLETVAGLDLTGLSAELIVVDNGSTDETQDVIASFRDRAPIPVTYVHEGRPGLAAARNAGIRRAAHPVILFTDDDCLPARDWVLTASRLFSTSLLQVIGGRVELYNPDHLGLTIKTSLMEDRLRGVGGLLGFLHGANLAFGRPVIDRIGWFDVRFGAGTRLKSAEDTEFVYRAFRDGLPVRYDPDLVVRHDHGRSGLRDWVRMTRGYSKGVGGMAMKHVMAGRTDVLRMVYWDVRSGWRSWRAAPANWRLPVSKLSILAGALRFALASSWRRST
jgi:glycosyltransferase involved in cell wall biosynthesis